MKQQQNQSKKLLTVSGAAKLLDVYRGKVSKAVKEGVIPSVKLGERRLIPEYALDEWIKGEVSGGEQNG